MENKITTLNKLKRKKFFSALGVSVLGVAVFNRFPFNLFGNSNPKGTAVINGTTRTVNDFKLQSNPLAVNRKKTGGKNA